LLFFQFSSINLLFFGSLIPWSLVRRSFQIIFNTAHGAFRLSVRQPSFREETFWRSEASSVLAIEDENWEKDWVSRLSCLGKKRRSVVSRRNTGIGILLVVRVIFRQTLNSEKVTSIFLVQFSRLEYRGSQEGSLGSDGKWINGQASERASESGRKERSPGKWRSMLSNEGKLWSVDSSREVKENLNEKFLSRTVHK